MPRQIILDYESFVSMYNEYLTHVSNVKFYRQKAAALLPLLKQNALANQVLTAMEQDDLNNATPP